MPITDCPTHGEFACIELCEHLATALDQRVAHDFHTLPVFPIRMCGDCFREHGVAGLVDSAHVDPARIAALRAKDPTLRAIGPDHLFQQTLLTREAPEVLARLEAVHSALNARSRLVCDGCIDAIRVAWARETGAPLPDEPFDHTVVNGDDPLLHGLAELVRSNLTPRGNHEGRFYGCQVFAGTALRPLLVRIFGVSHPDGRAAMLDRIDRFFVGVDTFQRRVQFFDAMEWEEHPLDGGGVNRIRRPFVLIEEHLVRSR